MTTINPVKVSKEICKALDIDVERVSSMSVTLSRGVAVIDVKYLLSDHHAAAALEVIKRYDFVERAV